MTTATIEILEGPGAGRTMALSASLVIGRGPEVDISLDDSRVSVRHARLAVDRGGARGGDNPDAGITVEDLGSSNGTFVNGMAVDATTWLCSGDELLIGVTLLTLRGPAVPPRGSVYREPGGRRRPAQELEGTFRSGGPVELRGLLDVNVKRRARRAPLALLALVVAIVSVYLVMS